MVEEQAPPTQARPLDLHQDDVFDAEQFDVERVHDRRLKKDYRNRRVLDEQGFRVVEYLVRWKHYTEEDDTWEPRQHLNPSAWKKFHENYGKHRASEFILKNREKLERFPKGQPRRNKRIPMKKKLPTRG